MLFTRLQRFNRPASSSAHPAFALREELDNLFKQAWFGTFDSDAGGRPLLDVYENTDGLVAKLEIPGIRKEDITISLNDGVLKIAGERKPDSQSETSTVCRCERAAGKFERSITLPYKVNEGNIKATCTDGVLTVKLPKAEEAKPKQIAIEVK